MPEFSTPTREVPRWNCSHSVKIRQRWFVSGVEPNPSLSESASLTIALARSEATTSRTVGKQKEWAVVAAQLIAPVKSPPVEI